MNVGCKSPRAEELLGVELVRVTRISTSALVRNSSDSTMAAWHHGARLVSFAELKKEWQLSFITSTYLRLWLLLTVLRPFTAADSSSPFLYFVYWPPGASSESLGTAPPNTLPRSNPCARSLCSLLSKACPTRRTGGL